MAMASFAPFFSRRLSPLLLPFLLSPRPPARHCFVFSGGLLQLHRHSFPASSSICRHQPQLAPGTDAEEEEEEEEEEEGGGAEQQGKKKAASTAEARRQPSAALRAPRPSAPKKPKKVRPVKPGPPKEGSGGHGGAVHAAPAYSPTSSSSREDDKKAE